MSAEVEKNPLLKMHIHNLKIVSSETQGTLFYNKNKGIFEKQEYANWFIYVIKVLFVSPIRFIFGFTSNTDAVYGGLQRLFIESEKALMAKPYDEQSTKLLILIDKIKKVTLPALIKDMHDRELYSQESAFIRLHEQMLILENAQVEDTTSTSTDSEPIKNDSSQDLSDTTIPDLSEQTIDLPPLPINSLSPYKIKTPLAFTKKITQPVSSPYRTNPSPGISEKNLQPLPENTIDSSPSNQALPTKSPLAVEPMMRMSSTRGRGGLRGGHSGTPRAIARAPTKEEKITNLAKVVEDLKENHTDLLNRHNGLKNEKINNQKARKESVKRQNILCKSLENMPREFKIIKMNFEFLEMEFATLSEKHEKERAVFERRQNELKNASVDTGVVVTRIKGQNIEVPINSFEQSLQEALENIKNDSLIFKMKESELGNSRKKYEEALDQAMTIEKENKTIGEFLEEQERIKSDLIMITQKQDRLEKEQNALINEINEAKKAVNAKQRELDKMTGKISNIEEGPSFATPKKGEIDPDAIKNAYKKKQELLIKSISQNFSGDSIFMDPNTP